MAPLPPSERPVSATRPHKRRRPNSQGRGDGIIATTGENYDIINAEKTQAESLEDQDTFAGDGGDSASLGRACVNCRRSKLGCSRTQPCAKCVAKRVTCVYNESDKKRGPRPGYIEDLNSRMELLEKLVLGQSLMIHGSTTTGQTAASSTLQSAMDAERARLLQVAQSGEPQLQRIHYEQTPTNIIANASTPQNNPSPASAAQSIQPARFLASTSNKITQQPPSPPQDVVNHATDFYEFHIQKWLPIMPWAESTPRLTSYDPHEPLDPWIRATLASAAAFLPSTAADQARHLDDLRALGTRRLFQSAEVDQMRLSLLTHYVLLGKGRLAEVWGIGTYLVHLILRLGLHVEDEYVSPEQHSYRRLLRYDGRSQSWVDKESVRRVFWVIFLLDRFSSVYAGVQPCIDAKEVKRLLPCPGKYWQNGEPVHTRDFVPASMAVQVQTATNANYGGYACLIEATEILTTVISFATKYADISTPKPDVRMFLTAFLELDLILTNWKAELPPQLHQATYDENGYMDHNITLAHLTHNTSSILLYQSPRSLFGSASSSQELRRTLLPRCAIIKQAAKEIATICTRFTLHRPYIVSPQFIYCQFSAARALLAYSRWTMEGVDEDFETLLAGLAESARRWAGEDAEAGDGHVDVLRLDNLASMLHARLLYDKKTMGSINLTTPMEQLLREANIGPGSLGVATEQFGKSPVNSSETPRPPAPTGDAASRPGERPGLVDDQSSVGSLSQEVGGGLEDLGQPRYPSHLGDILVQMTVSQPESVDARLFMWDKEGEHGAE